MYYNIEVSSKREIKKKTKLKFDAICFLFAKHPFCTIMLFERMSVIEDFTTYRETRFSKMYNTLYASSPTLHVKKTVSVFIALFQ